MYLSSRRIRNLTLCGIGIPLLFLAFLYSNDVMVGFSEFAFLSGGNEVNTLSLEVTGGDTTGFSVKIYNTENISMTYKLWFVDASVTNDWFAQWACLSINQTGNFWRYVSGDISLFTLTAGSDITKTLSVTFPTYYSWIYHWCIMFFPLTTNGTIDMNTVPRRGWFIDALVHPTTFPVYVKAFPSNRVYQETNNENIWILKIYDISKALIFTSQPFTLNSAGTGETLIYSPPGAYYVAFKWQSHLASYLEGKIIWGTGIDFFDFTIGANLYGAQNINSQEDDGNKYQTAWDLKNTNGAYDFVINGNDISIVLNGTFPLYWASVLEPRNLNGDDAVNASDLSVIGGNALKKDSFAPPSLGGIFIR
ncbi:MAG: hypothetical protein ACD_80C00142G0024 [uncultured bacterium (gcode 4)]|uniref:Uncharacterized protein n=1 Tax=uncultured bacterium (gcode 4) TaxID=1234023 RepID=K1XII3_9BACT|nr:MAG: hypothetical protein ACD_80C00142G0024 [uncultured bacterium (gcode 4)]